MGVLDSFLNMMRLNPDDEDDFYDDDYYEEEEAPVSKKTSRREKSESLREDTYEPVSKNKPGQKITPMRPANKQGASGMEVCVIKPTTVEHAMEITIVKPHRCAKRGRSGCGYCPAHYRFYFRFLFCHQRQSAENIKLYFYYYTGIRGHFRGLSEPSGFFQQFRNTY